MDETNMSLLRIQRTRLRQSILEQAFSEFLFVWQEAGFRYSDLLRVQESFARSESSKLKCDCSSWKALAELMEVAVIIAETPGAELP